MNQFFIERNPCFLEGFFITFVAPHLQNCLCGDFDPDIMLFAHGGYLHFILPQ